MNIEALWHKAVEGWQSSESKLSDLSVFDSNARAHSNYYLNNKDFFNEISDKPVIIFNDFDKTRVTNDKMIRSADIKNEFEQMICSLQIIPCPFQEFSIQFRFGNNEKVVVYCITDDSLKQVKMTFFAVPVPEFGSFIGTKTFAFLCGWGAVEKNDDNSVKFTHSIEDENGFPLSNSRGEEFLEGRIIGGFLAFMETILMLSTKGIEQEIKPAPEKLNKARAKKGKPPIQTIIRLRVSSYQTKNGEIVKYDSRKPVKLHWRRGHMRGVWCGSGEDKRLEDRYIHPCLVNFQPGDCIPPHLPRVFV